MPAGTVKRIAGPAFIANAVANLYTPPASTIATVITQIHFCNVGAATTFIVYVGATGGSAAGTQIFGDTYAIAANAVYDWWAAPDGLLMLSTDFLTGVCAAASRVTHTIMGYQYVV